MNINFEGNVNGEKFTDLESFMKALNALKDSKENKNISLSYKTSWGDDDTKEEVKNGLSGLFQNKKKSIKQLKPVDPSKIVEEFDFDVVNGDEEHDDPIQDEFSTKLYNKYQAFQDEVADLTVRELTEYEKVNDNRLDYYQDLLKRNEGKIAQIEDLIESKHKEINSLQHKLDICEHVKDIQGDLIQYHSDLAELIQDYL